VRDEAETNLAVRDEIVALVKRSLKVKTDLPALETGAEPAAGDRNRPDRPKWRLPRAENWG